MGTLGVPLALFLRAAADALDPPAQPEPEPPEHIGSVTAYNWRWAILVFCLWTDPRYGGSLALRDVQRVSGGAVTKLGWIAVTNVLRDGGVVEKRERSRTRWVHPWNARRLSLRVRRDPAPLPFPALPPPPEFFAIEQGTEQSRPVFRTDFN